MFTYSFFSHAHIASGGLSAEQQQFQQLALEFAKQELAPHMKQWDEDVKLYHTQIYCICHFHGQLWAASEVEMHLHVPVSSC